MTRFALIPPPARRTGTSKGALDLHRKWRWVHRSSQSTASRAHADEHPRLPTGGDTSSGPFHSCCLRKSKTKDPVRGPTFEGTINSVDLGLGRRGCSSAFRQAHSQREALLPESEPFTGLHFLARAELFGDRHVRIPCLSWQTIRLVIFSRAC